MPPKHRPSCSFKAFLSFSLIISHFIGIFKLRTFVPPVNKKRSAPIERFSLIFTVSNPCLNDPPRNSSVISFWNNQNRDMYYIPFVVHVESFVVHGAIPCSPLAELNKGGTGGQQGHTQARLNKKNSFTNKQSRSTKETLVYSLSTAQRDTLGRIYWGSARKDPMSASKWSYTGIFWDWRVLSFYHM